MGKQPTRYTIYAYDDYQLNCCIDTIYAETYDLSEAKDLFTDAKVRYNWVFGEVGTQDGINTVNLLKC